MSAKAEPALPGRLREEARPRARGVLGLLRWAGERLQRLPRSRAWIPLALWLALIWLLSSGPIRAPGATPAWGWAGNLMHAALFGILALWAALLAPRERGWPALGARASLGVLALVLAYGVLDELHQSAVRGRDASVLDLATDMSGAISVLAVARYAGRADACEPRLLARLGASLLACGASAALATWLPFAFPGVAWL